MAAMDHAHPSDAPVTIMVDGRPIQVRANMTIAAAMMCAEIPCHISVRGEPRAPLCGMGVCFECAATVDGEPLRRTCQMLCREGMEVATE